MSFFPWLECFTECWKYVLTLEVPSICLEWFNLRKAMVVSNSCDTSKLKTHWIFIVYNPHDNVINWFWKLTNMMIVLFGQTDHTHWNTYWKTSNISAFFGSELSLLPSVQQKIAMIWHRERPPWKIWKDAGTTCWRGRGAVRMLTPWTPGMVNGCFWFP